MSRSIFSCDNTNHSTTVDNYFVRNHSKIVGKKTNLLIDSTNIECSLEGDSATKQKLRNVHYGRTLDDTKKMSRNVQNYVDGATLDNAKITLMNVCKATVTDNELANVHMSNKQSKQKSKYPKKIILT